MINVEKPTGSFLNKAVVDFYVINKKKWFKIMSFSFFILNVVSNVLFIIFAIKPNSKIDFAPLCWLVCWVLCISEYFFINWYIGVFCTILIVLTISAILVSTYNKRAVFICIASHCFSSMWLSYLIANFIFTNKTYHFLFFVFTLVFLLLLTLALVVCHKKKWFGLHKLIVSSSRQNMDLSIEN